MVRSGRALNAKLALTFDDGPSEWTEPILDLLAEHGRGAVFFVVGSAIAGREATLARMVAEGCVVGNHTWSHPRMTTCDALATTRELGQTNEMIQAVTGARPVFWRPPYFASDPRVEAIARSYGLANLGAGVVPDDWALDDPEEIVARVRYDARARAVVCLHDGIPPDGGNGTASRWATVEAVRLLLAAGL
jgi:peptidoglycan/xylan/chitin deacetylase (PgdA/CDA1 family)